MIKEYFQIGYIDDNIKIGDLVMSCYHDGTNINNIGIVVKNGFYARGWTVFILKNDRYSYFKKL